MGVRALQGLPWRIRILERRTEPLSALLQGLSSTHRLGGSVLLPNNRGSDVKSSALAPSELAPSEPSAPYFPANYQNRRE